MIRPAASVAHGLAAAAAGILAGGMFRGTAALVGGGTESSLHSLALLAILLAIPGHRYPPRPTRALKASALLLPGAIMLLADPLRLILFEAFGSVSSMMVGAGWIETTIFGLAMLPLAGVLRTALRGAGRFSALWAAAGLVATCCVSPGSALLCAGVLGWMSDQVAAPHRGWRRPEADSPLVRGLMVALGTTTVALCWAATRSVLDPTPTGALTCLTGALLGLGLGCRLAPRSRTHGFAWTLCWCTILLGLVSTGSLLTDRVGAAATAWEWGLDGRIWLLSPMLCIGLLGGLAIGPAAKSDRTTASAAAIGLIAGPYALSAGTAAIALGVLGTLLALSIGTIRVRIFGAAVAAASAVLLTTQTVPSPGKMGPGIFDQLRTPGLWAKSVSARDKTEISWQAWVPSGTASLSTDTVKNAQADARIPVKVELDGLNIEVPSRATSAEELAGHLAALLSPDPSQIVVLNDALGEVVRGLRAHPTSAAEVAVPYPGLIRTLAAIDPIRRETWLDPHVHLQGASSQRRLAATARAATIVEISRVPWTSGESSGLTATHLKAVQRRLGPGGIYVLCVHLNWWPDGGPAAIAREMSETFPYVQIWLPPSGADSLLWVASDQPLPLARLHERFSDASGALERMGYGGAAGLAGTAIASNSGGMTWGAEAGPLPSPDRLPSTLFARPVLHAAGLATAQDTGEEIWDASGAEDLLTASNQVLQARRMFLELIDASARGQIVAAFDTAKALMEEHGELGAKTLEPLIDPHIADAEAALSKGSREGATSKAWDQAHRLATTAQMLAPRSPRPYVILAEVALGRGDVPRAEKHFRTALQRDPKHLGALDGLARCGRLSGDTPQVEQSLRATTRHSPQDWSTWHNLGIFLLEQDRVDEALAALETAAARAPADQPGPLIGMAKAFLAKDEPAGALVRAERATRLDPKHAVAWYLRGRAHYELERYDEAEQDFRHAVLADGSLVEARGAIGQIRAIRGDYAAAAEQFNEVLRRDPNNVPARENLRRLAPLLPAADAQ